MVMAPPTMALINTYPRIVTFIPRHPRTAVGIFGLFCAPWSVEESAIRETARIRFGPAHGGKDGRSSTHYLAYCRCHRRLACWYACQRRRLRAYRGYHRRNNRRLHRWLAVAATRHCDRGRFCCRDYQRLHRCGYSVARFAPG